MCREWSVLTYLEHQFILLGKDGDRPEDKFEELQVEIGALEVG